jgi:hypothetical protein
MIVGAAAEQIPFDSQIALQRERGIVREQRDDFLLLPLTEQYLGFEQTEPQCPSRVGRCTRCGQAPASRLRSGVCEVQVAVHEVAADALIQRSGILARGAAYRRCPTGEQACQQARRYQSSLPPPPPPTALTPIRPLTGQPSSARIATS